MCLVDQSRLLLSRELHFSPALASLMHTNKKCSCSSWGSRQLVSVCLTDNTKCKIAHQLTQKRSHAIAKIHLYLYFKCSQLDVEELQVAKWQKGRQIDSYRDRQTVIDMAAVFSMAKTLGWPIPFLNNTIVVNLS